MFTKMIVYNEFTVPLTYCNMKLQFNGHYLLSYFKDEGKKDVITAKLVSLEQEMAMERKQRKKSQTFYKKLTEPNAKQTKGT